MENYETQPEMKVTQPSEINDVMAVDSIDIADEDNQEIRETEEEEIEVKEEIDTKDRDDFYSRPAKFIEYGYQEAPVPPISRQAPYGDTRKRHRIEAQDGKSSEAEVEVETHEHDHQQLRLRRVRGNTGRIDFICGEDESSADSPLTADDAR